MRYEARKTSFLDSTRPNGFAPLVIIVGLGFPRGNALGLLKQMKDDPELERIPIIVLSAVGDADRRRWCANTVQQRTCPSPFACWTSSLKLGTNSTQEPMRSISSDGTATEGLQTSLRTTNVRYR